MSALGRITRDDRSFLPLSRSDFKGRAEKALPPSENHGKEPRRLEKIFVAEDPRFFFDLGVRLPAPSAGRPPFFFTHTVLRFDMKPEQGTDVIPKSRLDLVFHLDGLVWLLGLEVHLAHRGLGAEVAATDTARELILRLTHSVAAAATGVAIFPRTVPVMSFFGGHKLLAKDIGSSGGAFGGARPPIFTEIPFILLYSNLSESSRAFFALSYFLCGSVFPAGSAPFKTIFTERGKTAISRLGSRLYSLLL